MVVLTLARREVVRFLRQRSRVTGALLQPLVFWLLLGAGLSASFRPGPGGASGRYMEYFFPGILALAVLFSAVFSTISVVEDRKSGFLQGVLVAPVPRFGVVAGQAVGSTLLGSLQAALLLLLAPVAGVPLSPRSAAACLGALALLALCLSALGLALAWRMTSTQGFHAIMNLVLMPLWLLSGAFFPAEGVPGWMGAVMAVNPLTYGLALLRRALYADAPAAWTAGLPGVWKSLVIVILFGLAAQLVATMQARRAEPQ
jgi:ABC-2 type transport system permease protein